MVDPTFILPAARISRVISARREILTILSSQTIPFLHSLKHFLHSIFYGGRFSHEERGGKFLTKLQYHQSGNEIFLPHYREREGE